MLSHASCPSQSPPPPAWSGHWQAGRQRAGSWSGRRACLGPNRPCHRLPPRHPRNSRSTRRAAPGIIILNGPGTLQDQRAAKLYVMQGGGGAQRGFRRRESLPTARDWPCQPLGLLLKAAAAPARSKFCKQADEGQGAPLMRPAVEQFRRVILRGRQRSLKLLLSLGASFKGMQEVQSHQALHTRISTPPHSSQPATWEGSGCRW